MTDVRAKNMTSTAAAAVGPCRVRGMHLITTAAGSVSFKNGGSGGAELLKLDFPSTGGVFQIDVPSDGVWFTQDPYVTLTNVSHITFFYG